MLKSKLLKKYLFFGFGIALVFFIFGSVTNHLLMTMERDSKMLEARENGRFGHPPGPRRGPRPGPRDEFSRRGDNWRPPPPPPMNNDEHRKRLYKIFSVQIIAILLAVGITILFIFSHFKGRTREIESVLQRIKDGDLKARMPVGEKDEFGLAMGKFNIMADEIENLVGRLRDTESTRRVLLSELAHDIRTPIASVINLMDIFKGDKKDKLNDQQKEDIIDMSYKEVKYIARLVEDLLFLGKIEEPSYRRENESVDLQEIVREVVTHINVRYPSVEFELKTECNTTFKIDPTLASRLFRNILENAFSFAKSKVKVEFKEVSERLAISVSDDGPGMSSEMIYNYGVKKFSRQEVSTKTEKNRISVGLGSVIVSTIVKSYHGELIVQNNKDLNGNVLGALINIHLPFNR